MNCCPLCGSDIEPKRVDAKSLRLIPMGWLQSAVMRELSASYPRYRTTGSLLSSIYHGDEPSAARTGLMMTMKRLRDKIEPLGWTIRNLSGTGGQGNEAKYLLCRIESADDS